MPKALTKDIVNSRLAADGRGIVLVGEYVSALTKSKFKCSKGHFWRALPSNTMRGHGCPECLRSTEGEINERIKSFGVELIGDWNGYRGKSKFKCKNGHEWVGFLSNVMRSRGCARCHGHARHTKESVNELLKSQGRTVRQIDECKYAKSKNVFKCEKGHTWMALPDNILSGKGCPHCYGVKDCIYVWQSEGEIFNDKNVYKIGVTKTSKGRGRIHQCAKSSGRKPKILRLEKVKDSSTLEKQLLSIGRRPDYSYKFDGYSEMRALNDSELAKVLDMIDNAKDHLND
jgi:hypothetical protein